MTSNRTSVTQAAIKDTQAVIDSTTGKIVLANNEFREKYGNGADVVGMKFDIVLGVRDVGADSRKRDSCVVLHALRTREQVSSEEKRVESDGGIQYIKKVASISTQNDDEDLVFYREEDVTALKYEQLREFIISSISHIPENNIELLLKKILGIVLSSDIPWLPDNIGGAIFLVDGQNDGCLLLTAGENLHDEVLKNCTELNIGECLCSESAQKSEVIQCESEDCCAHKIKFEDMASYGHWVIPLVHNGTMLGVVYYYIPAGHKRNLHEEMFLLNVADVVAARIHDCLVDNRADRNDVELNAKNNKLKLAFDDLPVTQYITNAAGEILYINPAGRELFRLKQSDIGKVKITELLINPSDRQAFLEKIHRKGKVVRYSMEMKNRDGGEMHCLISAKLKRMGDGKPLYYGTIEDETERFHLLEKLRHDAGHDILTNLPNRGLFIDRLSIGIQVACREGQRIALLYIDLDHFKIINDTAGHAVGDSLLAEAARRLVECVDSSDKEGEEMQCIVRRSDTVARLGGDEFAVVLLNIQDEFNAGTVAKRIVCAMARPFVIGDTEYQVSASIGVALFPDDAGTMEKLRKAADDALYRVKEESRNGFSFYSDNYENK